MPTASAPSDYSVVPNGRHYAVARCGLIVPGFEQIDSYGDAQHHIEDLGAARRQFMWVADPRTPGSDDCVGAYFIVDHPGDAPHGYGENFDLGCDPKITITASVSEGGARIDLTDAQLDAVEAVIIERFDFRAAERAAREQDAELVCLGGVL